MPFPAAAAGRHHTQQDSSAAREADAKHTADLTRSERAGHDTVLKGRLRREELPQCLPRKNRSFGKDVLAYCHEQYPGVTRGRLRNLDRSLYGRLQSKGLLKELPGRPPRRVFGDPLVYYQEHYAGVTRGALSRIDPCLYARLRRDGLLHHLPLQEPSIKDPLAHYRETYPELTRGQLKQRDRKLYEQLKRLGLIERLPRFRRQFADPLAYFLEHYGHLGLRRTELAKRDSGLYQRLNVMGCWMRRSPCHW